MDTEMGQSEILSFLQREYEKDKNKWFTPKEIIDGMQQNGQNGGENRIHFCLMQLATFKMIDFKGVGLWEHKKVFRFK